MKNSIINHLNDRKGIADLEGIQKVNTWDDLWHLPWGSDIILGKNNHRFYLIEDVEIFRFGSLIQTISGLQSKVEYNFSTNKFDFLKTEVKHEIINVGKFKRYRFYLLKEGNRHNLKYSDGKLPNMYSCN